MRRDDERLADILEAAEKIAVRAAKGRAAPSADLAGAYPLNGQQVMAGRG